MQAADNHQDNPDNQDAREDVAGHRNEQQGQRGDQNNRLHDGQKHSARMDHLVLLRHIRLWGLNR
jgi:hypothetical protein